MPLQRDPYYHNTTYGTATTAAESEKDFRITADTPYLAFTGELLGAYCEDFREKLTALQRHRAVYCCSRKVLTGDSSSAPTAFAVSDDRAAIPKITTESSSARAVTCCLTAPSHRPTQGWLIVREVNLLWRYFITAMLHERHGVSNFQHIWSLS